MTNLDGILKSRDITLPTKVCLVKVMVFPVVMYGCESWTVKKAEHRRIDAFEQWCWRRLLRVPWTARRSNQSILKEISPGLLGSSPSRIQGNPQDERCRRMRERVRQSSGLSLKFIFARLLYTLNYIFWGEVHIAYTQGISKHYSNLTFNRNWMSPTYFFIHKSLFYHWAFRLANILWLAPGVT